MTKPIYFDNAATTMMCDEAQSVYLHYSKDEFYNASAAYTPSVRVEKKVVDAGKAMMDALGARKGKMFFTSGGTESDNMAILGAAKRTRKKHVVTSAAEHPAVLNACRELEAQGYEVTYLPVDESGFVSAKSVSQAVYTETFLVSVMHVNNETGAVQDIKALSKAAKERNPEVLFHSDGVQAYGNTPVNLDDMGVDMYSLSAHKIHGPKGMGALYVRDYKKIRPISFGGGQQEGIRPGTINSPSILAFAKAFEIAKYSEEKSAKMREIKRYIEDEIKKDIEGVLCISGYEGYSDHILNVAFKDVNAETLLHTCQYAGLILSTGAACSSRKDIVSHTLKQMNVHRDYIGGAVRMSFSRYNTMDEAKEAVKIIKESVEKLRKYTRA